MACRLLRVLWLAAACALAQEAERSPRVLWARSGPPRSAAPRLLCQQAAKDSCQPTPDRETYLIDGIEHHIEYDSYSFGLWCDAAPLGDVRWPRFPVLMHPQGVELSNCPPPPNSSYAEALRAMNMSLDGLSVFALYNMPADTKIESSAFEGLETAASVYLQGDGGVWRLPSGAMKKFSKATWMFLDSVFVDRLPPLVDTLYIRSTKTAHVVNKLPEGFLKCVSRMLSFQAANNNYHEVPADLFRYSPNIATIDLSNNKLSNIPIGFFDKVTKLSNLDLSYNRLKVDAWFALNGLVSLKILSLRGNPLHKLPTASTVRSLRNLRILNLGNTNQRHADFAAFHDLTNLVKLGMESNQVSSISCRDLVFLQKNITLHQTVDLRDNPLYEVYCSEKLYDSTLHLIPHTKVAQGLQVLVDSELRCSCGASWTERLLARMQRRLNGTTAPALDRESCRHDAGSDCE